MSLTLLIILGTTSGIIANLIDPRKEGGVIGPVVLGIMGAIVGAVLGNMILGNIGIENVALESAFIPTLGALSILLIARLFKFFNRQQIKPIKIRLSKEVKQVWS